MGSVIRTPHHTAPNLVGFPGIASHLCVAPFHRIKPDSYFSSTKIYIYPRWVWMRLRRLSGSVQPADQDYQPAFLGNMNNSSINFAFSMTVKGFTLSGSLHGKNGLFKYRRRFGEVLYNAMTACPPNYFRLVHLLPILLLCDILWNTQL